MRRTPGKVIVHILPHCQIFRGLSYVPFEGINDIVANEIFYMRYINVVVNLRSVGDEGQQQSKVGM